MFEKLLKLQILAILAAVPFYTPLNVALQSRFGFRESNIFITASTFVMYVVLATNVLYARRNYLLKKRILLKPAILASVVFCISVALYTIVALLIGVNYRTVIVGAYGYALPFVAFLGIYLLAKVGVFTDRYWKIILRVLVMAYLVVAVFALASYFVLPRNVLDLFGYSKMGIKPYQYVGTDLDNIRVLSFAAGPNQLGIYAVMMMPICWYASKIFGAYGKKLCMILIAISPVVIYVSKSRSAFVALLAILGGLVVLNYKKIYDWVSSHQSMFVIAFVSCCFILPITLQNNRVQSTLIRVGGSDDQRIESWFNAGRRIVDNPIGHGVGASGKGSFYSEKGPVVIENYYLQIAYDLGIIGIIVWMLAIAYTLHASSQIGHAISRNLVVSIMFVILTANLFIPAMNDVLLAVLPFVVVGFVLGNGSGLKLKPNID